MKKKTVHTTLHLYKQNFKFSAAHFLIFDEKNAEKLHGHNYQVSIDLAVPESKMDEMKRNGFFVDFTVLKQIIKSRLDHWDEHVLLPALHPDMKIKENESSLEVNFRERFYVFPKNEVQCLSVTNTSVEQMSRVLAEDLISALSKYSVKKIRVRVEETRGQASSTTIQI